MAERGFSSSNKFRHTTAAHSPPQITSNEAHAISAFVAIKELPHVSVTTALWIFQMKILPIVTYGFDSISTCDLWF